MQKPEQTQENREFSTGDAIRRFRHQLEVFGGILARTRKGTSAGLEDFDAVAEQMIGEIFGSSSEMLEAYSYAQLGEAAGLINLPEEAQEPGGQDTEQESLQQRKRVLERCIAELESR